MARMDEAPTPDILYTETANASIVTPASGNQKLFVDTDHLLKLKNSSGTVTSLAPGMANVLTTTGDIIYSSSGTTAARRAIGSTGDVLTVAGGVPTWAAPAGGSSGILQSAGATRTAGDLTTTSTTFVDVTGITVTLTTGAHRCLVYLLASVKNNTSTGNTAVDIAVDTVRQGQDYGLGIYGVGTAGTSAAGLVNICFLTGVLSAASHTIKAQWRVDAGTGTMFASTGVTPVILTVIETGLTV